MDLKESGEREDKKYEIKIKLLNHFAGIKRIYCCLHVQFRS